MEKEGACSLFISLEELNKQFAHHPQDHVVLESPPIITVSCFQPFSRTEIIRTMKSLDGNKAGGLDGVSPRAFKEYAERLAEPFEQLLIRAFLKVR